MLKQAVLAASLGAVALGAQAAPSSMSYGWEDGSGTVLTYYSPGSEFMQYTNTDQLAYTGNRSLLIEDNDPSNNGTPNATLAWITGLNDGDTITASFEVFDSTAGSAPSLRIWGHYTDSTDVTSYKGSAGGNGSYSSGTGWETLSHSWTFDSQGGTRSGLAIEVRMYDSGSAGSGAALVDDLFVTTSAGTIMTPAPVPVPAAAWLFLSGLAGMWGMQRKQRA